MIQIPLMAYSIIQAASDFVVPNNICWESAGKNRGVCIDKINSYYGAVNNDAYCTKFAWVCVNIACEELGLPNLLPKSANGDDMIARSDKSQIPVDRTPTPGCIFRRNSSGGGKHTGIVVWGDEANMYTIEGNTSFKYDGRSYEGVWSNSYRWSIISDKK